MAVRAPQCLDRQLRGLAVAILVQPPDELAEMVRQGGAQPRLTGRATAPERLCLLRKTRVRVAISHPHPEPLFPGFDGSGQALKIVDVNARGNEPRRPVRDRSVHALVGHQPSARSSIASRISVREPSQRPRDRWAWGWRERPQGSKPRPPVGSLP